MKKVRQPKPWKTYVFECKECGSKIAHTTQQVKIQDTCGVCLDIVASDEV